MPDNSSNTTHRSDLPRLNSAEEWKTSENGKVKLGEKPRVLLFPRAHVSSINTPVHTSAVMAEILLIVREISTVRGRGNFNK